MKKQSKRVAVIRNEHTQAQMSQLDDEWASSNEPSLTIEQAMEIAKAHQVHGDQPKLVTVIKNGHTDAELDEMEERWLNHQGPYMTLAETLAHAAERDKERAAQAQQEGG
jgi:hypothetical protein